jgi:hypothetical protein
MLCLIYGHTYFGKDLSALYADQPHFKPYRAAAWEKPKQLRGIGSRCMGECLLRPDSSLVRRDRMSHAFRSQ